MVAGGEPSLFSCENRLFAKTKKERFPMIDRISRRSMLTGAVAAGAASLASSVVSAAPATKWDETVDVIVIGSGFAGLAAAIEAKKAGANVVVLKRCPRPAATRSSTAAF